MPPSADIKTSLLQRLESQGGRIMSGNREIPDGLIREIVQDYKSLVFHDAGLPMRRGLPRSPLKAHVWAVVAAFEPPVLVRLVVTGYI